MFPLSLLLLYQPYLNPGRPTLFNKLDLYAPLPKPILIIVIHISFEALFSIFNANIGKAVAGATGQWTKNAPEVFGEWTRPET